MVTNIENTIDNDSISSGGYSEIIIKETGHLPANIQFNHAYRARAAYQNVIPGKDAAYVSILVLAYNNLQKYTKHCVESILNYTTDIDYELVLLDNGSSDGTFEYFKSVPFPKKRMIKVTQNKGGNYGLYLATNHLMGRYVAMIANDVYVTKNWLSNMLKCAESDERIGFVAPAADNVSNFQAVNLSFNSLQEMQLKAQEYNISDPQKWEERLRLMPAVALYKKECLDIVGSLDYAFQHDFSDDDISIRIRRAGYKIMFCGDVFVHHEGPTVTGTISGTKSELLRMGRIIFRQKYFGVDPWDDVNNFELLMLSLVNPEDKRGTSKPEVLGIDVMCGAPILQLKNKLRHADIFDANLSAFVQDPKYWLDLKTICEGTVAVDRIKYLTEHFSPNSFDYILLGMPVNSYQETDKILSDMLSLLKTDGHLLIKLRNPFDMKAFLDSMKKGFGSGNKSITFSDINNLNQLLMRYGYAIKTVRKSLYNIGDANKKIIRNVLKNSDYVQNIDAAFNELLAEDYALTIMKNAALQDKPSVDPFGTIHKTSSDSEISIPMELPTHANIAISDENHLLCRFQQDTVVQGMTSIIILTHNRLEQTKKCVKSIRKHTPEVHEIIFVDNGSTDSTVRWLQSQVNENKNCRLIENTENIGVAKGRNQGSNLSQGELILLLDNDVVVSQSWLSGMLECMNHAPAAGIVGPMTNNTSGLQKVTDESCRLVDHLDKYAPKFQEHYHHRRIPCGNISGFCMLFKRALAEKIGLLDEHFGTDQFEDEDFCWRSALEGYQNYIAGDVFIYHNGGKESGGDRSAIEKKCKLSMASPEGRKLAVLKARELASDYYSKGKMDQAIEALINCIKLAPNLKEIYYELALILIETKKFSEAWEVVESMPEAVKSDLKSLECAGYAKEGMGLDEEATAYANSILSPNEKHPAALNLKGILAFKKGDKDKAQDYFQKAIDDDPGYGEAYTNLGVLYWGIDKKDEALQHLQKGFILSPTVPDVSSIYYSAISSLGIFSDAEAHFREACRLYPHNKNLAFLHIDLLIQQGKFDTAMTMIEDALDLFGLDEGTLNAALAVREKLGPRHIDKASKKGALSLCMIVKNEEKYLVQCLKSVRDLVDEIIVVDTGSVDNTMDIAKIFGAKLFDFTWTGDFSAARNESLKHAIGDWIFVLDADEVISAMDLKEFKKLIQKKLKHPSAYKIVTRNYTEISNTLGWMPNDGHYREEAGSGWVTSAKVRLFPNRKGVIFQGPVHEILDESLHKAQIPAHPCKIIIHHYGMLDKEREKQKGEKYYQLGKEKYQTDPMNVKYIHELAKQAHLLDKYDEAVELWLKLLSRIEYDRESAAYQEIARSSYGEPIPEIYMQLASAYLNLERFDDALSASRKTLTSNIISKEYRIINTKCEIIAGPLKNALAALAELGRMAPDESPALLLKAVISCLQGEKRNAREIFELLQTKGVHMTPSLNKMAKQLHTHAKKDQALMILDAMIENKINDAETLELLEEVQKEQ